MTSQVVGAVGAFITSALSARLLGPHGRGELAWLLQISYIVAFLAVMGRDRAVLLGVRAHRDWRDVGFALALDRWLAFLLVAAALGAAWGQGSAAAVPVVLMAIGNVAYSMYRAGAVREGRAATVMNVTLVTQLGVITGLLLLVGSTPNTASVALLFGGFMVVPFVRRLVRALRHRRLFSIGLAELRAQSRQLGAGSLAMALSMRLDRLIMPFLASNTELGYYSVVASLTEVLVWPMRAAADSLAPALIGTATEETRARIASTFKRLLLGSLVGAVALILVGPTLVRMVFGDAFLPAASLIPMLTAAALFLGLGRVVGNVAVTLGQKRRVVSQIEVLGLVCSAPLYFILIPTYGAHGAAFGSLVGYAVVGIGLLIRSRRILTGAYRETRRTRRSGRGSQDSG